MSKQTLTSHGYRTTITRNSKGAIASSVTRYIGVLTGLGTADMVGTQEDFKAGSRRSHQGTARGAKSALNTYPFRPPIISYSSGDFVLWLDTDRLITDFEDALLLSELLANAVDHIKYLKEELKDKS